ncbi:hypothetical protein SISNIDRAFT_201727 [Sistotremastrum niveocremeum HHB9708]|uniref:RING-type domain-containing protein n=1 Tax=Sistotremastrum niveocremeum HHB9708 TaxID=1314777 RepID=A0A164ZQE1_9AGAM|nr:hypothetical protein SISNIDRAFT_201727 [Sistotremastrum niveocremeum HHB9708]
MIQTEWIDGSSDEEDDEDDAPTTSAPAQASRLAINEPSNTSNCPLCLEPFREMSTTRCGHAFCHACIERALGVRSECPVCRAVAAPRHLRRVFLGA